MINYQMPEDTRKFLGIGAGNGLSYTPIAREMQFKAGTNELSPIGEADRDARYRAASEMLFNYNADKLDDIGLSALYQSVTKAMFGIEDRDGSVAFGKRASKDPRQNLDMLRRFVKGEYNLIEDPEYTEWKTLDEEEKFRYALENESFGNKTKSTFKGERGFGISELAGAGMPGAQFGNAFQNAAAPNRSDVIRRTDYESLTDEEKQKYRDDVIADYDKKLSRRQTLANFLQVSGGLSDRASWLLAKSFNDGIPDENIETLAKDERDRVYSAFSMMRGDRKQGHLLFIPADFTDDTFWNRAQLGLYGMQQSVLGLFTDTASMAKDLGLSVYAKTALSRAERKDFYDWWNAQARVELALQQNLPEAETAVGAAYQGVMENLHWIIPYSAINKGGKIMKLAGSVKKLKEQQANLESGRSVALSMLDTLQKTISATGKGEEALSKANAAKLTPLLANVARYEEMLAAVKKDLDAAKKWRDAAGTGIWFAGEAQAFSAFAQEYITSADAAGISREESVFSAAVIGLVNAQIEKLYVPGLEADLSPSQIKNMMWSSALEAVRSDGGAGFRRYLANRIPLDLVQTAKVTTTEGFIEEPLQQLVIEHGKAFDGLCEKLRANGQDSVADQCKAFWDSIVATLPDDYATFIDTAADALPTSIGFGVTSVANMKSRQHYHNLTTRHANRRAGATEKDSMMHLLAEGDDITKAYDYDVGIVDMLVDAIKTKQTVQKYWEDSGETSQSSENNSEQNVDNSNKIVDNSEENVQDAETKSDNSENDSEQKKNPYRAFETINTARNVFRNNNGADIVSEIAKATGLDVKTSEVVAQYLQNEEEAVAFSPTFRAWTALNMSLAEVNEQNIASVLPGYVQGSFTSDKEKGIYSAKVRLGDGSERTIAYKVGDISEELRALVRTNSKINSTFGKSYNAKQKLLETGKTWESLSDHERWTEAMRATSSVGGFSSGKSGVFELTDSNGKKVLVNADDVIYLSTGRIADIGYGAVASMGEVRHETFHSLWRFTSATFEEKELQDLANALGVDTAKEGWKDDLDETMAYQMQDYASGHYVSHAVSSRFDKMLDGWAGKLIGYFRKFGYSDEVKDPTTGKSYLLKDFYDKVLRGELGSGFLGIDIASNQNAAKPETPKNEKPKNRDTIPLEVTDEERKQYDEQTAAENPETPQNAAPAPETPQNAAPAPETPQNAAPAPETLKVANVPEIEVQTVEAPVESLSTKNDPSFSPQIEDAAPVLVNTEPSDGVPIVVGGGNVVSGSDIVEEARKNGKKTVKIKKITKVKAPRKKREKKSFSNPDPFHPWDYINTLNPFDRNRYFSISRYIQTNGVYKDDTTLLEEWHLRGNGLVRRPNKYNKHDVRVTDHIDLLSVKEQNVIYGLRKNAGVNWDELPQIADRFQDWEPEDIIDEFLKQYRQYKQWKENGGLTMEEEELVKNQTWKEFTEQFPQAHLFRNAEGIRYDLVEQLAEQISELPYNSPEREELRNDEKLNARLQELDLHEQELMKKIKQLDDAIANDPENEFPLLSEWEDKFPEAAELMYTLNKAEIAKLPKEYDPETGREMFSFADTLKIWNDEVEAQILDGDNSDARFGFADDELRRQYDDVVARWTNPDGTKKPGWMKAPNGKPTNLTERQWIQVRTPSFKKWFGDWETNLEIDSFHSRVKAWMNEDNVKWARGKTRDEIFNRFGNELKPIAFIPEGYLRYLSEDILDNRVYSGMGYMIDHAVNHHPEINPEDYSDLQDVIDSADDVKIDNRNKNRNRSLLFIKKIEKVGVVIVSFNESMNGKIVLHKSFFNKMKEGRFDNLPSVNLSSEVGNPSISHTAEAVPAVRLSALEDKGNIPHFVRRVNPSTVSKVVDENGEPLVVYHGSNSIFTEFETEGTPGTKTQGTGAFFTNKRKVAVGYSSSVDNVSKSDFDELEEWGEAYGGGVYPVFLNIKKPLSIECNDNNWDDIYGERWQVFNENDEVVFFSAFEDECQEYCNKHEDGSLRIEENTLTTSTDDVIRNEVRNTEFDGAIFKDIVDNKDDSIASSDVYVILNPNQVKSATDNTGAFDSTNPDIRYSIGGLYTGSAADYEKPSLHYVGTGEGEQVYGWGLYASNVRGVAEKYEYTEAVKRWLRENPTVKNRSEMPPMKRGSIYEQTFFTDRAPGDESHLLKWYEPVSEEQFGRIKKALGDEGVSILEDKLPSGAHGLIFKNEKTWRQGYTGAKAKGEAVLAADVYTALKELFGSAKAASEFLARAGIDGVKYPVDSYGGKGVKDGDEAGWNYVSFRDDNIRVDHKWVDGDLRFSITQAVITDEDFSFPSRDITLPSLPAELDRVIGGNGRNVLIKKNIFEKNLAAHPEITPEESRNILDLALYHATLVGQSQPKKREHYWVAVNRGDGKNATVVVDVYPTKENVEVVGWRSINDRGLEKLKRQTEREDGQLLMLSPDNGSAAALSALASNLPSTPRIIPQTGAVMQAADNSDIRFSLSSAPVDNDMDKSIYPAFLNTLSDDELVAAAVASRAALGKTEKDSMIKIGEINSLLRRLHPDWDKKMIGKQSESVIQNARELSKRIRNDLDRGVSESTVLSHLPQTARDTFGAEMREEARRGAKLGSFRSRVNSEIDERQARMVENAVRIQSGIDADAIENAYGINLSDTIMRLAENRFNSDEDEEKQSLPDAAAAAANDENAIAETEQGEAEVDAAVQAVVDDIVDSSKNAAEVDEKNRERFRNAMEREAADRENGNGDNAPGGTGDAGVENAATDNLAQSVKKNGIDLESPRHLARLIAELARRRWIEEHNLKKDSEIWRNLVALQFLRKTAQSIYAKLCGDLTYSRGRETVMMQIAKLDAAPTFAGILSKMEFIGALINAKRIRETQFDKCKKLDNFLKLNFGAQGRFKPDKEDGKRKVSAEAELRARYMRQAMWFSPEKAKDETEKLQQTINQLSIDFGDAGRDVDQSREFVDAIRKLNILREFGALRYRPLGEIDTAVQWWEEFANGQQDQILQEMNDREIRTVKAAHLLAVAFADPKRQWAREGGSVSEDLNRYITGHMGFISLLQDCMRFASEEDRAMANNIISYLNLQIQKSGDKTATEFRRNNDAFHAAVEKIYGRKFNDVMQEMNKRDDRFAKFMGKTANTRIVATKARAMQLLVSLLQEGRKTIVDGEEVWIGGYHDNIIEHKRVGQAEEIKRLLSPADLNMIKWIGDWYEQNRSELSDVCKALFGIGVYSELSNYFPVKMLLEKQGLEKGEGVGWTIFPKALTPRIQNKRDFDTSADIFSMWSSRMEEAAQWKHHAKLGLELRGIFGRAELQASVIANHGSSVNSLMQGFITDILAGHGAYDRSTAGVEYFSDQIRGWTALCALGGNLGVMLKQTTSIPAFGFEIGLRNTAKHILTAFTEEGMNAMTKIWESEQRRTRWQSGSSEVVQNALKNRNAGVLKRMMQASMITTKIGDIVPSLVVGQGIYRDCIERGMSEEDAMAETWSIVERTQQSGRMENQISVQRRNKFGRLMFQFLSTQQQYLQYEIKAIREVIARPNAAKRWHSLGRALVLNHFILTSLYFWAGEMYKSWLGQEPPEDQLKDWMISCLLGPFGSLMVAGSMCKATLERAIKGYFIKGPSMLPMEQWTKTQINDASRLIEAIFSASGNTWDQMLDEAMRWASDFNSTIRDIRKVYRFRIMNEPQKR